MQPPYISSAQPVAQHGGVNAGILSQPVQPMPQGGESFFSRMMGGELMQWWYLNLPHPLSPVTGSQTPPVTQPAPTAVQQPQPPSAGPVTQQTGVTAPVGTTLAPALPQGFFAKLVGSESGSGSLIFRVPLTFSQRRCYAWMGTVEQPSAS